MLISPKALMLSFSIFSLATPLIAGELACAVEIPPDDIVGTYTMVVGTGSMTAMGHTMPYPNTDMLEVTIAQIGDDLVLQGPHQINVVFSKVGLDEPDWDFSALGLVSEEDVALALGCDNTEDLSWALRNGLGEGSFVSEEGILGQMWMRFIIFDVSKETGVSAMGGMIAKGVSHGQEVTFNLRVSLEPTQY